MNFTKPIFHSLILVLCLGGAEVIHAEETDQFTLPPTELMDIGPTASARLYEVIERIRTKTNEEIQRVLPHAQTNRRAAAKLASLQSGASFADSVYDRTGPGLPLWLRGDWYANQPQPIKYSPKPWQSAYWLVFSQSPLSFISLVPTINMYDHYFGSDKLGHFFMQGHTYYTIYSFLRNHGKTLEQAHDAIVNYGQVIEYSYLGTMINGVWSNADLSANYSGFKFYRNLSHSVKIGDKTLAPILVLKGNFWEFSKRISKENLLEPYISDNLNEALNPSHYTFMRGRISKLVKDRCGDWIARRGISKQSVEAKLKETSRWHGESYGHRLPLGEDVSLKVCFG